MKLSCAPRSPWLPLVVALAALGCDPKLTGPSNGGGGTQAGPEPVVTPEALVVGNILALHAEILRAGLSVAAHYDTAQAAPAPRGVLADGCWTLTELDAGLPRWGLALDGCTDANGTAYRGGGEFDPVTGLDGFVFLPWYDTDLIRAMNESNADYNHDVNSGSFEFAFERASGAVAGVVIHKFLRHNVRSETVTFTYEGAHYSGAPGAFGDYPDVDSAAQVVWDGVGIFGVDFQAGGQANYTIQGTSYQVDLATGHVIVADGV